MFMKKWWLEHTFQVDGHRVEFRGWINTTAERKEDFPEMVYGTFWARQNPALDGDGMRGMFLLDGEKSDEGNYVFGSVYPVYLEDGIVFDGSGSRENADRILQANEPLAAYPRFEARIEDCVKIDGTYIVEL